MEVEKFVASLLAIVPVLISLALLVRFIRRASKHQRTVPQPPANALFVEKWASGRNLGSWRLKMGGASRCLLVALTEDCLITALQTPFNLFSRSDLEHEIPVGHVTELTEATSSWSGPLVRVRFRDPNGREQAIELMLTNQRQFLEAWCSLKAVKAKSAIGPHTLSNAENSTVATLPLPDALRRYWLTLAGVCLFPTLAFVGFELFGIRAAWVIVPLFFVTFLFAMRPVATRRAPFAFWLVVIALWSASAFPAMILVQLIKWVRQL